MKSFELHFNPKKNIYEVMTAPVFMQLVYADKTRSHSSEKNWMPFVSQSQVFYVHSINPFTIISEGKDEQGHVLREQSHDKDDTVVMHVVTSMKWTSSWMYGTLRGSTNLVRVGDYFVGIAHTRTPPVNHGTHWVPLVYFNAALMFDATFPHTLRKVSKVPFVRNEWYEGAWCCMANKHLPISYAPYPHGLVAEEEVQENGTEKTVLYVSMSVPTQTEKDSKGYVVRIMFDELLATMEDVTVKQEDSASWLTTGEKKHHPSKAPRRIL
jgi:hypothetical protein